MGKQTTDQAFFEDVITQILDPEGGPSRKDLIRAVNVALGKVEKPTGDKAADREAIDRLRAAALILGGEYAEALVEFAELMRGGERVPAEQPVVASIPSDPPPAPPIQATPPHATPATPVMSVPTALVRPATQEPQEEQQRAVTHSLRRR